MRDIHDFIAEILELPDEDIRQIFIQVSLEKGWQIPREAPPKPIATPMKFRQQVFVTMGKGRHFHRQSCQWAVGDLIPMEHENAVARGFKPCKTCCS